VLAELMKPGNKIAFHKHHNAEEILILEEGGAEVTVGDKFATVGRMNAATQPTDSRIRVPG
jgi:mannose-6-phosphate isomerase-like protein (cupin superfamily)